MRDLQNSPSPGNRPGPRLHIRTGSAAERPPFVRRTLSPESGRALEILGHAIEYLADEYAAELDQGPLGNADPRVEAIQLLKAMNRAVYYSGAEVPTAYRRIRRWFLGSRIVSTGSQGSRTT